MAEASGPSGTVTRTHSKTHHMRWRDKLAYLEKEGQKKAAATKAETYSKSTDGVEMTEESVTQMRRHSSSSGRPHHMRWRDKVAYLEHEAKKSESDEAVEKSKESTKTYSHTFTHHPPHMKLGQKLSFLRKSSLTGGHPSAPSREETAAN